MRVLFITLLSLIAFAHSAKAQFIMPNDAPQIIIDEYERVINLSSSLANDLEGLAANSEEYLRIAEQITSLTQRQADLEDIIEQSELGLDLELLDEENRQNYLDIQEQIVQRRLDLLDSTTPTEITNLERELDLLEDARGQFFVDGTNPIELDFETIEGNTSQSVEGTWLFSKFINALEDHTYNFVVAEVYTDLSRETNVLFQLFVGFWLLYTIITIFFLSQPVNMLSVGIQIILIVCASTMLSDIGRELFISYFYNPVVGSFYFLSNFFMEKATAGLGLSQLEGLRFDAALLELEKLFKASFEISGFLMDNMKSGWLDVGGILKGAFYALVFIISVSALIFLFCAYWSYAIFALHVLLALTPIMIVLGVFTKTRVYFYKWLSGVINYLAIPVVLSISMGITIFILNDFYTALVENTADKIATGKDISDEDSDTIMSIILICFLSFLLHLRVGEITAFLTQGISNGLSSTWALGIMAAQNTANFIRQSPQMMAGGLNAGRSAASGLGRAADGAANTMSKTLQNAPK